MENNIKTVLLTIIFASVLGCASKKEVVQGYNDQELATVLKKIQGKNRRIARQILGNPAIEGKCKKCNPSSYRMIYLTKDMARFYLGLSYGTDMEIECLVFDFHADKRRKEFIFNPKTGFKKASLCNQKGGAILELQQILDSQI